jgi:hypothetical protein
MSEQSVQSSVAAHEARNRELTKVFLGHGADLSCPRTIDLHFWAPDQQAAEDLAEALNLRGLQDAFCKAPADSEKLWNVEAHATASVTQVTDRSFVEDLVRLAASCRSDFDGWGTLV